MQQNTNEPGLQITLAAACLGVLVLGVNGTAIMAALPTMRGALALGDAEVEWAINAYLVVSAVCIIPGGKAGDRFGARRIALAGFALFAAASAIVATADDALPMLVGRALQGLAAALAVPGSLAACSRSGTPEHRAAAVGAWAGFLMLGFSLGPLIGGTLTHFLGWRAIFWANGAGMLVATVVLRAAGAASVAAPARSTASVDWCGFASMAVFMTATVAALHALPTVAQAPLSFVGLAALAAVAAIATFAVEHRAAAPLVDPTLFRLAGFGRAVTLASIAMSCILALLLFYNLDAQSSSGFALTAVSAGLSLLPLSGGLLAFAFFAPRLNHRFGPRCTLTAANLLVAAAGTGIAVAASLRTLVPLMVALFAAGIGLALPYATAPRLALSALPSNRAGAGAGVLNACTFLGGSIGVAAGAVTYSLGGLPGAAVMIALLGLWGAWLSRGLDANKG